MEQPHESDRVFSDTSGREWLFELDFLKLREIKPLADFGTPQTFLKTWADLLLNKDKMLSVIWTLVGDSESPDDFLSTMNGATLAAAQDALLRAIFFFTQPEDRMFREAAQIVTEGYRKYAEETEKVILASVKKRASEATKRLGTTPRKSPASSDTGTTAGRLGRRSKPFMRDEPMNGTV